MQRLAGFSRIFWLGAVLGTTGAEGFAQTASPEGTIALPEIEVLATSPLPGGGENRDKIPAQVQSVPAEDFVRTNSPSVTDTLQQQVPAAGGFPAMTGKVPFLMRILCLLPHRSAC
jgi:hypothetical protein